MFSALSDMTPSLVVPMVYSAIIVLTVYLASRPPVGGWTDDDGETDVLGVLGCLIFTVGCFCAHMIGG